MTIFLVLKGFVSHNLLCLVWTQSEKNKTYFFLISMFFPSINLISNPISSSFSLPPSSRPVYFSDICTHLPAFISRHPVIMICLTKASACLHFQKFINDPPHLAVSLIGPLFLHRTSSAEDFLMVGAPDLHKCLFIMIATPKP